MLKSKGPRTDPCVIPIEICCGELYVEPTLTLCILFVTRGVSLHEKAYEISLDLRILRFWERIGGFFQIFGGFFGFLGFFHLSTMTFPSIKIYRNGS